MISKFSVLPYFAAAAVVALAWYWFAERPKLDLAAEIRRRIPSLALAASSHSSSSGRSTASRFGKVYFANISLPAPELFAGIRDVLRHNAEGHPGYLLGTPSKTGFWYFYFVDLAVKTPLALLVLFFLGATFKGPAAPRRAWLPLAFVIGIFAVALFSHINIGIRHVMPLYAGMAVTAAAGAVRLLEARPLLQVGRLGGDRCSSSGTAARRCSAIPITCPTSTNSPARIPKTSPSIPTSIGARI